MKFLFLLIGVIVVGLGIHQAAPWWSIAAVAAVLVALIGIKAGEAILGGFLGAFILWAGTAWYFDIGNDGILSTRMGALLGGLDSRLMILLTGALGGLLGGLGALTGRMARRLVAKR